MKKRTVTNTTRQMGDPGEALGFLAEAMAGGGSPAAPIYRQEAQGQQQLVNSDVLPTDGSKDPAWEKIGVKFGQPVDGDPIFRYVELPQGWKKRPTGHSMHSELIDEQGRVRARIFYKAAFYDRSAHMSLVRRITVDSHPVTEGDYDGPWYAGVFDGKRALFRTEAVPSSRDTGVLCDIAKKWADEHYPQWDAVTSYWDDDLQVIETDNAPTTQEG